MIHLSTSIKYYKRQEIQKAIVEHSLNKEVAVRYNDRFGKRPDVLQYPRDVLEFARKGASSFHISEERWKDPLRLIPTMSRRDLDELRTGWDLVLDIDCRFLEYSKAAAELVLAALKQHGIRCCSVKFSGNLGFHIGLPFEAFPQKIGGTETRLLFPEAAKRIALYVKEQIKDALGKKIMELEKGSLSAIMEKTEKREKDIITETADREGIKTLNLNVEPFLAIDTLLISARHIYRAPYSLHEKSGLVSVPIEEPALQDFSPDAAKPASVKADIPFMQRDEAKKNEALSLVTEAFDFSAKIRSSKEAEKREYEIPEEAIPEKAFPPCIQKLFNGMIDGRKWGLFILINFLSSCGWDYESMAAKIKEWNRKNKQPLKEAYLVGQLRYHKQHKKKMLPPNCSNTAYYHDIQIKCDESVCRRVKNPVNYARRRSSAGK